MTIEQQVERLSKALNDLAYARASKASGAAIRAGLKVLEKAIKAAAPVGPERTVNGRRIKGGTLKRFVGSRFVKSGSGRDRNVMRGKAGLNVGKGRPKAKGAAERTGYAGHSAWVALGTQPRWAGVKYSYVKAGPRKGKYSGEADDFSDKFKAKQKAGENPKVAYRGVMPANDFVARAVAAAEPAAMSAVIERLNVELVKATAKGAA